MWNRYPPADDPGAAEMGIVVAPDLKIERRLFDESIAWLSTVRADGTPHVTPVWFVYGGGVWCDVVDRPERFGALAGVGRRA